METEILGVVNIGGTTLDRDIGSTTKGNLRVSLNKGNDIILK